MEVRENESLRFFDNQAPTTYQPATRFFKVRCPSCEKLYSVDAQPLLFSESAPRFQCIGCNCQFEAKRPESLSVTILETFQINVPPTDTAPFVPPPVSSRRCPKCGTPTSFAAKDCHSCGVIFAKYKTLPQGLQDGYVGEIRLEGRREIAELWDSVMDEYGNLERHDAFLTACFDANLLACASRQYARILSASPNEETAREMRRKIIALASYKMEPRGRNWSTRFRVPRFNNLILVFGGAVLTMGLMLPNAKNLTSIGIAAIALALGVRFFLARPS